MSKYKFLDVRAVCVDEQQPVNGGARAKNNDAAAAGTDEGR